MQLRHLRIACLECHSSKAKCRCPPHKKESDSIARPVESRSPSQVADFGNSGSELNFYQMSSKQIGNDSPSPAPITQCTLTPGPIPQDLAPSNPAKSNFSMENRRPSKRRRVLSPPRHTQTPSNGVFDMKASHNDRSTPSYTWPVKLFTYQKEMTQNRIATGCLTCKTRRVKCDETKPVCLRCQRFGGTCDGYAPAPPQHRGLIQVKPRMPSVREDTLTKCSQRLKCKTLTDLRPPNIDDKMAIEPIPSVESRSSSSRSNTLSSFTEDETDWGEDEVTISVEDLDFSSFSSISQEERLSQARVKDSLTRPVFSPMKLALIDRIMKEFWIIFNQEAEGIQNRSPATLFDEVADNHKCNTDTNCERGEDSSHNSGSKSSVQTKNKREKSTQSSLGPRKRDDGDDEEQNDGEERSPKRPRTLLTPPQNPEDTAKFACPYRKRDPRKYCVQSWRSCALTPQDTVARVKGHLYRHHRIYPCQRCKALFENQDAVNQHLMQRNVCELRHTEHVDGITTEIFEKLRSKKKAQRDQTEADRWKDIFKLLFPGEMIPSPYFEAVQEEIGLSPDSKELADYEEYCRRELPRAFQAALEELVHNESQPLEESIRNQLMNTFRDCQDRVSSRYRSSSTTTAAVGSPSRSPMLSRPPVVDHSQESIDSISMASNTQTGARIAPPFFQPPPPQAHLRSRLEVSDLQLNSSKAPGGSAPSDSGYSSNESGNTLGIGSSSGITCDSACMSDSQPVVASATFPAASEEAAWNMDTEQFDVSAGNDGSNSKKNSVFESSFNNAFDNNFDNTTESAFDGSFDTSQYASQIMYGNTWDPSMDNLGMENLFSSDETL